MFEFGDLRQNFPIMLRKLMHIEQRRVSSETENRDQDRVKAQDCLAAGLQPSYLSRCSLTLCRHETAPV